MALAAGAPAPHPFPRVGKGMERWSWGLVTRVRSTSPATDRCGTIR